MRIALAVSDLDLSRALSDLLQSHGHVVQPVEEGERGCALRIVREVPLGTAPSGTATLVLQRSGEGAEGETARAALLEALLQGSRCEWRAPLNPRLLLETLSAHEGNEVPALPSLPSPSLEEVGHPWLILDPRAGRLRRANLTACGLLDLPRAHDGMPVDHLALPGGLREGLLHESAGMRPVEHVDGPRLAVWWTASGGQRVLCLLPQPLTGLSADDLHRRSLAELGRTAATLAHEIRNPVASISGALDLLEEEPEASERAQIIQMARERLRHLTKLLEFTLFLARPLRHESETVDLHRLVEATVASLRMDPLFSGVSIELIAGDEEVRVTLQTEPFRQALTNLLLNAAQAQDGQGAIRIYVLRDGRRGIVRIADDGPGVPAARRQEIFQAFFTTKSLGSGLGLSVVRRVMEAIGGAVTLEDVPKGASFRLEVPLALRSSIGETVEPAALS